MHINNILSSFSVSRDLDIKKLIILRLQGNSQS